MYIYNGHLFDIFKPHIVDDVQYPVGWFLDGDNREAFGLIEVSPPAPPLAQSEVAEITSFTFENSVWVPQWNIRQKTEQELLAERPAVPEKVTMRQARLALMKTLDVDGTPLLGKVAGAIASLPSPDKEVAEIEWEFSSEVFRHRSLVAALGALLGLTPEALDDLFILAQTL